jgi:type III restriction enzyme
MQLKLEELEYQQVAIQSVVRVFEGTPRNTFDIGTVEGIRANFCDLSLEQITENIKNIIAENGIDETTAKLSDHKDLCIEMETGTGKTLVYLKTVYELYKHYGYTKFIVLVPSIAIRQGTLGTLHAFAKQLENIYGFTPKFFEYNSKKLSDVKSFAEEQHPQIMLMTTAAIVGDDKIINREQREDLFDNTPYIEVLAKTKPVIIMDEPQEGMDADKTKDAINRLNPLMKIRYSATHKEIKNLLYRLTPYDSYKQGLVKKIEVLTVTEKNDEASLKVELASISNSKGDPKVKLKAWRQTASGKIEFKETNWLKAGDNLGDKTNNPSYLDYKIERIYKSLIGGGKWRVAFTNGTEIIEQQAAGNIEGIWALQLEWLIRRHFEKSQKLNPQGIKCLSLIFIDRVVNYMSSDNPKIKTLFVEKYKAVYPEFNNGQQPSEKHITEIQGYYFAQTGRGEYTDSESSMQKNKEIFELILQRKDELLTITNPVQFIFSHTALGVGWDNPNIFNIATLRDSYSDIRKRQEIGRGLRIAVNQAGHRVYDLIDADKETRINQLTVIPNETYQSFANQYQKEIKDIYGNTDASAEFTHTHKGKPKNEVAFKRNRNDSINAAFKRFWNSLAKKTDYTVSFAEDVLIQDATAQINQITIPDVVIEAQSRLIEEIKEEGFGAEFQGDDARRTQARFSPLDLIEELSENTRLSYRTLFAIVNGIKNQEQWIKNPPRYVHEAADIIRKTELKVMLRGLDYNLTGETFPFSFDNFVANIAEDKFVNTPKRGIFDKLLADSVVEKEFAKYADNDDEVICFLKLPSYYKIKTPIGDYEPDFGLVLKKKHLLTKDENEFYFVVETKGTNDINDTKALKESEIYKIKCALKHFKALGVDLHYKAPVKEYPYFKTEVEKTFNKPSEA